MSKPVLVLPIIETLHQAEAMGRALARVRNFDPLWAPRVFKGFVAPYPAGPNALNKELRSMWEDGYTSTMEREQIVVAYVEERLKR